MSSAFAQNYERALSGYSNEAGQINQNLANWRSDVDMVRAGNKTGYASAKDFAENKVDMDSIKGVADEVGLQGGKKIYEKYITKGLLDKKFFGNRSFNEVDKDLGDRLKAGIKSKLGIGQSKDSVGSEGSGTFEDFVKKRLGGTTEEASQRLDNLRVSAGETKSDGFEMTKRIQSEPKLKSRFGMDDDATEMGRPKVSSDDMGDNPDPFGRDQPESKLPDPDEVDEIRDSGIRSTGEPVNTPMEDLPVRRNGRFSDRVATPEEKPMSIDEMQSRFDKITKTSTKGGDVEMSNMGESKRNASNMDEDDPFDGMDFGEFKGQGGSARVPTVRDMNFNTDPAMQPDAFGMGNGSNQVAVRNAANDAEQASQDALSSARSGIAGASKAGEDMANGAKNAASDLAENFGSKISSLKNVGQQALTDGSEGAGSMFSNAARKIGQKLGIGAAEEGGEAAASGGLEAAGAVLDATPLAPLGWLFGGIGLALDGAAAYQAGKGVADWVSDDILGHHPAVNFKKTALPSTSAIPRSFSITPTMDSTMDIGSGSGSW